MDIQNETRHDALLRSIKLAGGVNPLISRLNKLLEEDAQPGNIKRAHVSNWLDRDSGTPAEFAIYIEIITNEPRENLRPDFPWHRLKQLSTAA